ncbi:MAG: bifunctional UDP-sugar hydrolase/5'-nucleotidase [Candidatus Eisenbacteria bacterium]
MRSNPIALALFLALAVTGTARAGEGTITLFHTNDLHSHYEAESVGRSGEESLVGGFAALEATLRRERETAAHSLYLDAGDFMTGTPLSDIDYEGARGGAIVAFYNLVGLDAQVLGNHEFDQTLENLDALISLAEYPVLAANLRRSDGSLYTGKAYETFTVGDVRVGVIGITIDGLSSLMSADKRAHLEIDTGIETLVDLVDEVDGKSDLVVVLSHEGIDMDREIARVVDGIDVIVGGHSHTRLGEGEWVKGVLIVQAGSNAQWLGRADLVVRSDSLAGAECRLVRADAEEAEPSAELADLVEVFQERIDDEYGYVIADAPSELGRCYFCESDLGNWVTDRLREETGADVALLNSGGIRQDIAAGPVTKLDIFEVLPFWNQICVFTCAGEDLLTFALTNAIAEAEETHGILQVSGLTYSWWQSPEGIKIHTAMVGGKPVDPAKSYKVASVDFVVESNADRYLGFVPKDLESLGVTLTSRVMDAAARLGTIDRPLEDRIQRVEVDFAAPAGR